MLRSIFVFAAIVACSASAARGQGGQPPAAETPPPVPPRGVVAQKVPGWEPFESREGRFRVLMPQKPAAQTRQVDTVVGKIDLHVFMATRGSNLFAASYADYPRAARSPEEADLVLRGVRDGNVNGVGGELVEDKQITVGGHPAREIKYRAKLQGLDDPVFFITRLALVGPRLFQFGVVMQVADEKNADVQMYLSSFELVSQ